jgi:tetratricopeptide (TPR) repeat protein
MEDVASESELRRIVLNYVDIFKTHKRLLEYRKRLGIADDHLTEALCKMYAIRGACRIRECLNPTRCQSKADTAGPRDILPDYETVQNAANELLLAVASNDETAISGALEAMEVFSLCPNPDRVFSTLEEVVSRISGPVQQVFLTDLALSAARVGDFQGANKYIQQARAFEPSSRELYDICVVEGLMALNAGNIEDAVRCLDNSTKACQADVDSSVQCALLPPNLEIAEKLLELDERVAVLRYLFECHNVWQSLRPQIEGWIHDIESKEMPDFILPERDLASASRRMPVQWIRACSLQIELNPAKPRKTVSPAEVLAERERRHSKYAPYFDAQIKEQLKYLEKDMAISPDRPPSKPADPSDAE